MIDKNNHFSLASDFQITNHRKEAIEKAKQQSRYNDGATEYKVFEVGINK